MKLLIDRENPGAERIEPSDSRPLVKKVLWADHSRVVSRKYHDRKHLHHFHQLDVILEGEYKLILEDKEVQIAGSGDAWVIPPLMWHHIDCPNPFYFCSFKFHLSPHYWSQFGTTFHRFRISQEMQRYLRYCAPKWKSQSAWVSQQIPAVLSLCLVEFLKESPQKPATQSNLDGFRQALWPLLERILEKPNIHWNVARMAEELNLSPNYFSRCFHQAISQSPQRFILEATMRRAAANLLDSPTKPIKKIAESAGYTNVHTFTRAFNQIMRISPAAYRRGEGKEL